MTLTSTQQPDPSIGRRYSKAYKYVFAMIRPGDDLSRIDPRDGTYNPSSLVNEGRFVSLTLPREISLREPYATVVTVMQDGGKVVESKGQVLKLGSVSGTTGFLPPNSQSPVPKPPTGSLLPNVGDVDGALGSISGYLAFMNLRYLFRMFGDQRRQGNLDVQLHFFDYKNDDFWRIEPESFDMQRSSRRPMSYDYNISFKCLEYSDTSILPPPPAIPIVSGLGRGRTRFSKSGNVDQGFLTAASRLSDMTQSGLNFLVYCDTVVQRAFQTALSKLNAIVGFFQTINDAFFSQLAIGVSLLQDMSAELDFLSSTAEEFAPDNINQEINSWYLEVRRLVDNMAVQAGLLAGSQPQRDVTDTDKSFSTGRMRQGATTDLMQEPPGSTGSLDANPFIGTSGLSLTTDPDALASTTQFTTVVVNAGEDIYSLARRVLSDITRFIDLVLLNRLEFPFIVSDATQKPPNTLAWGESILVPATPSNTTSTTIADSADTSAVPTTSGTVDTSSLPSQLIDSTADWLPDQWIGYSVTATTGGSTQTLIANGNTSNTITLSGDWTITITPGTTTYAVTYNLFNPRRPVTPDARAYGTDLLVVFGNDGRGDLALGARSDLAACSGLDNFIQAITLRARCPVGLHPFHQTYGLPAPVGRPAVESVFVLSTFFIRRSLTSDPRVGKVNNVQFDEVGDVLMMSAQVQPIDSRLSRPISVQVGT